MNEIIKQRIDTVHRGEVPEGYKKKIPYIIPQDWQVKKLGAITKRTSRPNKDGVDRPAYSINNRKGFVPQSEQFEDGSYQDLDKTAYKIVRRGEFAYNPARVNVGSIGRLRDEDEVIVSSLYVCVDVDDSVDGEYFDAWTKTRDFFEETVRNTEGSVREYLFYENFANMRMPIPPLAEQQKIAEILSTCDRVIELKQQLLDEKRRQKQWLMQMLLDPDSGVRLPGFEGSAWRKSPLGKLTDIYSGGTPNTENSAYWGGEILWCVPSDITSAGKYIEETETTISSLGLEKSSAILLPAGTILMCSRATIGPRSIAKVPIATNQGFKSFVCKPELYNEFLYYAIDTVLPELLKKAAGNTFKEISKADVAKTVINIPCLEEQKAIAACLMNSDHEIELLEQELVAWQQKKKALMQLLLTGLVRVNA